jgi:hypothetical protein
MSYNYELQRHEIFSEDGIKTLVKMRDKAKELIKVAGAARADKIMSATMGDSWTMLAALDYMVETGDLYRVTAERTTMGQHQIFTELPKL